MAGCIRADKIAAIAQSLAQAFRWQAMGIAGPAGQPMHRSGAADGGNGSQGQICLAQQIESPRQTAFAQPTRRRLTVPLGEYPAQVLP